MCGIAGIWSPLESCDSVTRSVDAMTRALRHRGPDGEGQWHDDRTGGPVLGHTRLAILDLSEAGAQPMVSRSGRFVLTYNGEIYNYRELARELGPREHGMRSRCDTEVLLEGIEYWGLEATLERCVGMFAFAVWDREERTLRLVRDRLGIKPVYVRLTDREMAFASELGSLCASGRIDQTIDRDALLSLLQFAFIPTPMSIFAGVEKLAPGTILEVALDDGRLRRISRRYWDPETVARAGLETPLRGTLDEMVSEVAEQLDVAVAERTIADVPVGALLSGGVDSTAVVTALEKQGVAGLHTFTVASSDSRYDESEDARRVARSVGTNHVELSIDDDELLQLVTELPRLYSEPFADYSQLPTVAVCRKARQYVTVVLTGDGGDEVFAGYNRHAWLPRLEGRAGHVPGALRRLAAAALRGVPLGLWHVANERLGRRVPRLLGNKAQKLAALLDAKDAAAMYREVVSVNRHAGELLSVRRADASSPALLLQDPLSSLLLADTGFYLVDDILTKVDRASMSVGLEARVPLLDHRLFALAWRLPAYAKIREGETKWVLRRAIERATGATTQFGPKSGFGVPLDDWLRGSLRDWAGDLLSPASLRREGFFDPRAVSDLWTRHQSGREDLGAELWPVLTFRAWFQQFGQAR